MGNNEESLIRNFTLFLILLSNVLYGKKGSYVIFTNITYFPELYSDVRYYFKNNKYVIALRNYAATVAETVQAFKDYEYAERAQSFFNQIYYNELLDNIISHPTVEYASELANNALRKVNFF